MSTIKVLHVIARMNVGGAAKYVGDLVENVPNSELATGFVQGSELEDSITDELILHRIPHLGRKISVVNDIRAWRELRLVIQELQPDVVHTHTFKAGFVGRLVGGNHKRVHTFHGHLFDDLSFSQVEKMVITIVERYLAKKTDILISVGDRVGQDLRAAGIGANREWVSISPGVTRLPIVDKIRARDALKLDRDAFLVGWMGRMTSVKNPFLALEVAKRMPEVQFVFAGGGDLLQRVRENAPKNVEVIGWVDASKFWSAVDCAISTSDNEGMPIALIEAQLAGIPVIATNVGSISEIIEDGITGFVTQKGVDGLSIGLLAMISNSNLLRSMSVAAPKFAESKFGLLKMLEAHLSIYAKLVRNT